MDYRGEIKACIHNFGFEPFVVNDGDRIVQLVVKYAPKCEIIPADTLSETERGSGGFGSTGIK